MTQIYNQNDGVELDEDVQSMAGINSVPTPIKTKQHIPKNIKYDLTTNVKQQHDE